MSLTKRREYITQQGWMVYRGMMFPFARVYHVMHGNLVAHTEACHAGTPGTSTPSKPPGEMHLLWKKHGRNPAETWCQLPPPSSPPRGKRCHALVVGGPAHAHTSAPSPRTRSRRNRPTWRATPTSHVHPVGMWRGRPRRIRRQIGNGFTLISVR